MVVLHPSRPKFISARSSETCYIVFSFFSKEVSLSIRRHMIRCILLVKRKQRSTLYNVQGCPKLHLRALTLSNRMSLDSFLPKQPTIGFRVVTNTHVMTDPKNVHNLHFDQALRDIKAIAPDSIRIMYVSELNPPSTNDIIHRPSALGVLLTQCDPWRKRNCDETSYASSVAYLWTDQGNEKAGSEGFFVE